MIENFNQKIVVNFDPSQNIDHNVQVYKVGLKTYNYDEVVEEEDTYKKVEERLSLLCNHPNSSQVKELIIGLSDLDTMADLLIQHKDQLAQLTHLFWGDIESEECEMSWITQTNIAPLLKAFPNLQYFKMRGAMGMAMDMKKDGLSLEGLSHPNLKTFIIETGGLPSKNIQEIMKAHFPQLEHLEIWTGDPYYGFDGSINDFTELLKGQLFPDLKYLGLKNSSIADELAIALKDADILDKIETLDVSMGTLGDEGAQALLDNPKIKQLKTLNIHRHYMSPEMESKIKTSGINVNISGREKESKYGRYVEVGE